MSEIKSRQRVASHGEVFTSQRLVDGMLNMLEEEVMRCESRWLEPACGTGNFLVRILERRLDSFRARTGAARPRALKNALRALMSLHGIDALPDNIRECRRRLLRVLSDALRLAPSHDVMRLAARVVRANIVQGDALEARTATGKAIVIAEWREAGRGGWQRVDHPLRELRARPVHASRGPASRLGDARATVRSGASARAAGRTRRVPGGVGPGLRFDVVVGNPPYQRRDGGAGASSLPIYPLFVQQAMELQPRYVVMITPSRWMFGGRGLGAYRQQMLSDRRMRRLVDFHDSRQAFESVDIAGGVCYFLWDREHDGECDVVTLGSTGSRVRASRLLLEPGADMFVRDPVALGVLRKIARVEGCARQLMLPPEKSFAHGVRSQKPFGLRTYFRGTSRRKSRRDVRVRRAGGWVWASRDSIQGEGERILDAWKVYTARSSSEHAGPASKDGSRRVLALTGLLAPGEAVTETYIILHACRSRREAERCLSYVRTKFFRYLVAARTSAQDLPRNAYAYVPRQDLTRAWHDRDLYAKYGLTRREVAAIESSIREMPPTMA